MCARARLPARLPSTLRLAAAETAAAARHLWPGFVHGEVSAANLRAVERGAALGLYNLDTTAPPTGSTFITAVAIAAGRSARNSAERRCHIILTMLGRTMAFLLVFAMAGCDQPGPAQTSVATPPPSTGEPAPNIESSRRDLSADEAMGGHTLARHVGKTDAELRQRLRREPNISAASTYTDRAAAETVVGQALSTAPRSFESWRRRTGRRPNFVLHFEADTVIGRSLARGQREATPCRDALVVVRWDDGQDRFYVLTSYPEERR